MSLHTIQGGSRDTSNDLMERKPEIGAALPERPLGLNADITLLSYHIFFFFLDITMIVETSDSAFAGTDAEIRIKVFGTKGNVPERKISGSFGIGR